MCLSGFVSDSSGVASASRPPQGRADNQQVLIPDPVFADPVLGVHQVIAAPVHVVDQAWAFYSLSVASSSPLTASYSQSAVSSSNAWASYSPAAASSSNAWVPYSLSAVSSCLTPPHRWRPPPRWYPPPRQTPLPMVIALLLLDVVLLPIGPLIPIFVALLLLEVLLLPCWCPPP